MITYGLLSAEERRIKKFILCLIDGCHSRSIITPLFFLFLRFHFSPDLVRFFDPACKSMSFRAEPQGYVLYKVPCILSPVLIPLAYIFPPLLIGIRSPYMDGSIGFFFPPNPNKQMEGKCAGCASINSWHPPDPPFFLL